MLDGFKRWLTSNFSGEWLHLVKFLRESLARSEKTQTLRLSSAPFKITIENGDVRRTAYEKEQDEISGADGKRRKTAVERPRNLSQARLEELAQTARAALAGGVGGTAAADRPQARAGMASAETSIRAR